MPVTPDNSSSETNENSYKLPSPADFYLKHALYEKIDTKPVAWANVQGMVAATSTIDSYCPNCEEHSVFTRIPNLSGKIYDGISVSFGYSFQHFKCARNPNHSLVFILYLSQNDQSLQKVGQNPSVADLNMHDVKKYSSVLSKQYFHELKKAIGLVAHGVGVGSFVYLRRIFENLIEEARVEAAKDDSFDEQAFKTARMNDKIKLLSGHLPPFLVENHQLYGILSKGVHELSEQECLDAFPVVKVGIELILDEHIVEKQRRRTL